MTRLINATLLLSLSIMRAVIRTKSMEFMPFSIPLFLTLSAIMWLFYGLAIKDFYAAFSNMLGAFLGEVQMIIYVIFKYYKALKTDDTKKPKTVPDPSIHMVKLAPTPVSVELMDHPQNYGGDDLEGRMEKKMSNQIQS